MKLNKTQALLLSKILFNYKHSYHELPPDLADGLDGILGGLDSFLTGVDATAEDQDDDDDFDDDDDDDDEPEPVATAQVEAINLHDFAPPLQVSTGELDFELDDGTLDVLVNGYAEVGEVTYVVRNSDSLKVWENGCWHSWQVTKTPKIWKKLKNDVVYKVIFS